jgi:hypothetical protein
MSQSAADTRVKSKRRERLFRRATLLFYHTTTFSTGLPILKYMYKTFHPKEWQAGTTRTVNVSTNLPLKNNKTPSLLLITHLICPTEILLDGSLPQQ